MPEVKGVYERFLDEQKARVENKNMPTSERFRGIFEDVLEEMDLGFKKKPIVTPAPAEPPTLRLKLTAEHLVAIQTGGTLRFKTQHATILVESK